jgi:hypothetical protein
LSNDPKQENGPSEKGLTALLDELSDLRARNKALEIQNMRLAEQVKELGARLDQRFEVTRREYDSSAFHSMREKILQMFTWLEPKTMLTMEQLTKEFASRYPGVPISNIPRRVFELSEPSGRFGKKLGRNYDKSEVRYFLMLREDKSAQVQALEKEKVVSR